MFRAQSLDRGGAAVDREELDLVPGERAELVAKRAEFGLQGFQAFDVGNGEADRLCRVSGGGCQGDRRGGERAGGGGNKAASIHRAGPPKV